jgi:hypothetical protein
VRTNLSNNRTDSRRKSASRRRAEAALWRATKAEGLAQSKTLREVRRPLENASASWTAVALHRFRFKVLQIAFLRAGFEDEDDPASVF